RGFHVTGVQTCALPIWWSISVGAIKNYKQYTGSGEDYKPPKNYWKYYTNGLIPEKIDGSCDVLEFPIMIQYSPIVTQKSRLNLRSEERRVGKEGKRRW